MLGNMINRKKTFITLNFHHDNKKIVIIIKTTSIYYILVAFNDAIKIRFPLFLFQKQKLVLKVLGITLKGKTTLGKLPEEILGFLIATGPGDRAWIERAQMTK